MSDIKYPIGKSFTLKDCCGRVDVWKVIEHKGFVKVVNRDMYVEVFVCESIKPFMCVNGYVDLHIITSTFNSADERLKNDIERKPRVNPVFKTLKESINEYS